MHLATQHAKCEFSWVRRLAGTRQLHSINEFCWIFKITPMRSAVSRATQQARRRRRSRSRSRSRSRLTMRCGAVRGLVYRQDKLMAKPLDFKGGSQSL